MSLQDAFTPKEWLTLKFAPLWVFVAVAGADQIIDPKELRVLRRQLRKGIFRREKLASEALWSLSRSLDQVLPQFGEDPRKLLEGLEAAARLVDEKTSAYEAAGFKRALLQLGRQIAAASGGGFLGLKDRISAAEEAALSLVARALGVPSQ